MSVDDELMYDDQRAYSVPSNVNNYQNNDNTIPPDLNAQIDYLVNQKVEKKMEQAL